MSFSHMPIIQLGFYMNPQVRTEKGTAESGSNFLSQTEPKETYIKFFDL